METPFESSRFVWIVTYEEMMPVILLTDVSYTPIGQPTNQGWGTRFFQPEHAFSDLEIAVEYAVALYDCHADPAGRPSTDSLKEMLVVDGYITVMKSKDDPDNPWFRATIRLDSIGLDRKV